MANYITDSLEKGEKIVLNGRLHWSYIWWYLFFTFVFILVGIGAFIAGSMLVNPLLYIVGGVALVLALCVYLVGRILRSRTEFAVTTNRFIQKDGIFSIEMTEIPLFKIETVNFYQTFWQRIIGTGCIELVGSGGTSHRVHCIEQPMKIRKTIVSAINHPDNKE